MSEVLPVLHLNSRGYAVRLGGGPNVGFIEHGPNMHGWGWTCGFGWRTGLPTVGAALDALLADPAFGVDMTAEGRHVAPGDFDA
jgi:hypothetical protein